MKKRLLWLMTLGLSIVGHTEFNQKIFAQHQLNGQVTVQNIDHSSGSYDVVVSNIISSYTIKEVLVPTWTQKDGQDDLVWHTAVKQADGSYRYQVKMSEHRKEYGKYISHVYIKDQKGNTTAFVATPVTLTKPNITSQVTIANTNHSTGTYDVIVSHISLPSAVKEVLVPTWTQKNGQDDLVWHKAIKQADGTYRYTVNMAEHNNEYGQYISHVYISDKQGNLSNAILNDVTLIKPRITSQVTIENIDHSHGEYDVVISHINVPDAVKEVLVPTWTERNHQDDLVWHKAIKQVDGTYRYTVKVSEHRKEYGQYISHVYIRNFADELTKFVPNSVLLVQPKLQARVQVTNINHLNGTYDVVVSNINAPNAVKEVLVPTWTQNKGQDDLIWHVATKQVDGTYRYTIKASEHRNEYGQYISHVYISNYKDDLEKFIPETVTLVQPPFRATVNVVNVNQTEGTYDVVVSHINVPNAVNQVLVPTWTQKDGQDDLVWHVATKQADGTYRYTVNVADHYYEHGQYISHVYISNYKGELTNFVPNSVMFSQPFIPIKSLVGTSTEVLGWSWNYPSVEGRRILSENNGMYMKGNQVYITFDNGYEYQNLSSSLLDTLRDKNVKAVFFTTGTYMESNPELTRRMVREGHIVGNHTMLHLSPRDVSPQRIEQDIKEWEAVYIRVVGAKPKVKLYRPPYGHISERTVRMASNLGYKTVMWGLAYMDWETDAQPSEDYALNLLKSNTQHGDIVLLHAISRTNSQILGRYIDWLRSSGFTIGELK